MRVYMAIPQHVMYVLCLILPNKYMYIHIYIIHIYNIYIGLSKCKYVLKNTFDSKDHLIMTPAWKGGRDS